MIAQVNLVLNGIVYCRKGMQVVVRRGKGKYSIVKRLEKNDKKEKEVVFKVSNDLLPFYFIQSMSYPQL